LTPEVPNPNRVLVIDDSEFIHKLVRVRLRQEGLEVHCEYEGRAGIERAVESTPDLILLDVDLPSLDGFEVCRQLKEHPKTRNIPIIFLTGTTHTDSKVRGLDAGAVDYVTKPFDEVELRARVRAALRTKRLQDMLEQQSFLDGLTGLWNRSYLDRRLDAELNIAGRYGRPLSLLLGDIDHFKRVNDTYGHLFGDVVLQEVAEILREHARRSDIVTRYGGEEFALVMADTLLHDVLCIVERLRQAIESRTFDVNGDRVSITVSFGVGSTDELGTDFSPETLIGYADEALYHSKSSGRNRVSLRMRRGPRCLIDEDLRPPQPDDSSGSDPDRGV
jgi:diguanylate cyclase (GGDEF)-like protein